VRSNRAYFRSICLTAILLAAAFSAKAQAVTYQFVDLGTGPAGYTYVEATGVDSGQQVGWGQMGDYPALTEHAILWSGSASSIVDLNPPGYGGSDAYAVYHGQQVGDAWTGPVGRMGSWLHAMLWTGSADSYVDLTPNAQRAVASATDGTHQGGRVGGSWSSGGYWHASLWSGTAASWVDLNPGGYVDSTVWGMGGDQQVGSATVGQVFGFQHAILWRGSAASVIDLNPAGSSGSIAWATDGNQQVGVGLNRSQQDDKALLWSGSAGSVIDLTPSTFLSGAAYGVAGGHQVGYGDTGSAQHALVWAGSADSFLDLHTFLPANALWSKACAIDASGNIVGTASFTTPGQYDGSGQPLQEQHAVMWVPVPEPATLSLLALGGLLVARRRGA
jgi:hypothetical protein